MDIFNRKKVKRLDAMIDRLSKLHSDAEKSNAAQQRRLYIYKEQAHKVNDQRKYYAKKAEELQTTVYELESKRRDDAILRADLDREVVQLSDELDAALRVVDTCVSAIDTFRDA